MSTFAARLDLTPAEAARYFLGKEDAVAWDYTDVWRDANARSFTVAKATTGDVLGAIRQELNKVMGAGMSFDDFKRTLRPRLQDLGWWGTKEVLDGESGELQRVQLGSNRRLRTIFQTNVQTGYMAGRYQRYVADAAVRQYWRYVAINDGRTRPEHRALNGKVWRWDDPIWAVIWPPNGWGCRCRVVALTEAEFRALGVPLENGSEAITTRKVRVGRSDLQVEVQGVRYVDEAGKKRVFWPDAGWDYNPGEAWARHDPAGYNGTVLPLAGLPTWRDAGRPDAAEAAATALPSPVPLPLAQSVDMAQRMMVQSLLGDRSLREVQTPVDNVFLRPELLPRIAAQALDGPERFTPFVIPTLEQPFEVWLTPYTDGIYRKRYVGLFRGAEIRMVVVREGRDGALEWEVVDLTSASADMVARLRAGTLIYSRPQE